MLRVTQPFGDHTVGDEITDASTIEAVMASDQAAFVVRVVNPPSAEPIAAPEPAPADAPETHQE